MHTDPNARQQTAADLRDALRDAMASDDIAVGARRGRRRTDDRGARHRHRPHRRQRHHARATGIGVTSVLPVAAAAGAVVTPPPRTGDVPATKRRRFGRKPKPTYPKLDKAALPVKPLKPPKPKRRARKAAAASAAPVLGAAGGVPLAPAPKRQRTWKLRHWLVILAAPLLLIAGGAFAYAKLTEPAPTAQVPDIVDRDILAAIGIMKDAGFSVRATPVDNPRPGGTVLTQHPGNGEMLEEGSAVEVTVSKTDALVPEVSTMDVEDAKVELRERSASPSSPSRPTTATTSTPAR